MADHSTKVSQPLTYIKAILGGVGAAVWSLTAYVSGDETLADVTTSEWLFVTLAVLTTFGIVYVVPNKDAKQAP